MTLHDTGSHCSEEGCSGRCPGCGCSLPLRAIMLVLWPTRLRCPNCRMRLRFERVWDVVGTFVVATFLMSTLVILRLASPGLAGGERWAWIALLAVSLIFLEWWAACILKRRKLQTVSSGDVDIPG